MNLIPTFMNLDPTVEERALERAVGSAVGLACGDALGAPVETSPKHNPNPTVLVDSIPELLSKPDLVTELLDGGWHNISKGTITDDTEMDLGGTRSIVRLGRFDPADCSQEYLNWFLDHPIGIGGTVEASMNELKNNVSWDKAGCTTIGINSLGNGSVMRCRPWGIYRHKNLDLLIEDTRIQSRITHPHPDCCDSAVFINAMISQLIQGVPKEKSYHFGLNVLKSKEVSNQGLYERFARIPDLNKISVSGVVYHTVEASVYCLLTTSAFRDAVVLAVNLGGDADTTGAVTGALAGALYGESVIPASWKIQLKDRNAKPLYEEIKTLNDALYRLSCR